MTNIENTEITCRQDRLLGDDYRILPYRDLPKSYQMAIAWFMGVDGDAWHVSDGPCCSENAAGKAVMESALHEYVERYGDVKIGIAQVDTQAAKLNVMEHIDQADFGTWDEYHAWYLAQRKGEVFGHADGWPVLLNFGDEWETFDANWPCFHAYCRDGAARFPVWFFPKRRHFDHLTAVSATGEVQP